MGRPKAPGAVFYLGRLRYRPGIDPPELREFLEMLDRAEAERKPEILRAALLGGMGQAETVATQVEDAETAALMDGMLAGF